MEAIKLKNEDRNYTLDSFTKALEEMGRYPSHGIPTTDIPYNLWQDDRYFLQQQPANTLDEVQKIIDEGTVSAKQALSNKFFEFNSFYHQIVMYYATLLKYVGILIPNVAPGQVLKRNNLKIYNNALTFIDHLDLSKFCTDIALKAILNGVYYGLILEEDENHISIIDLPTNYCKTNFKDFAGNDLIQFDVTYFSSFKSDAELQAVLKIFPRDLINAWKKYNNGKGSRYVIISSESGICIPFVGNTIPPFISMIPATLKYEEQVDMERDRNADEIRKVLVQKIPHLTDGRLVFEPDEAEEMHKASVGMLRGNKNISVLTTYADVEAVTSKTQNDNANTTIEKMLQNIYSQAGTSSQFFASTGSSTLDSSFKTDLRLMMYFARKLEKFITNALNRIFSTKNIDFKFTFLPVSIQNEDKYIDTAYKLASAGYSLLIPAIAQGFTQRDIINIKDLENDTLQLQKKFIPFASAYTGGITTTNSVGAPKKDEEDKNERTIANEASKDNTANKQSAGGEITNG